MKLLTNLLFEPKGKHDPALAYNIKDTVMSGDGSRVYFALQDVPAGIALDNGDYWKLQIDLSSSKSAMDQALASFADYAKVIGMRVRGETAKASGNPVTFLPDAGSLLQPVTVLDVQQQGSGEPYPAGGGKNLLNNIRYYDNTHTDIRMQYDNPLLLKAGVTYTLSTNIKADGLYFVDASGEGSVEPQYLLKYEYQVASLSYTPTTDIRCIFIAIFNNGVPNGTTVQLEIGSQATNYAPPSNIRPIIGYDKMDLMAAGKNLLPNPVSDGVYGGVTLTRNPDGSIYVRGTCTEEHVVPIWGNGYDRAIDIDDCWVSSGPGFGLKIIKADGSEAYYSSDSIYLAPGDSIVWVYFHFHPGEVWDGLVEPQIELGNQRTSYEPYQGNNYTVQIGQTVYGGKFDWLTGKLVAEWAGITFGADTPFSAWGDDLPHLFTFSLADAPVDWDVLCSHYAQHESYDKSGAYIIPQSKLLLINDIRFNSADDFNAEIAAQSAAGTPVQVAYKLAEPIEIQLTPHIITAADPEQVNTLYGDGRIEAEYVKPLHVSIEERVAAAVAAAKE